MKNFFKLLIIFILVVIVVWFIVFKTTYNTPYQNTEDIINDTPNTEDIINDTPNTEDIVNYLCSETINDRTIGTEGNKLITIYIENLFKDLNLNTVFSDSFLNTFYYESENLSLSNVVGKLKGLNNKKAIIVTAHFDAWCNGALDNASGVATSFRIINKLKDYIYTNPLKYDVIFVMTNAEMAQFVGSKNFVEDIYPVYDYIYNINIDCVGAKNAGPIALKNISRVEESSILYDSLKEILKNNNIEYSDTYSTNKVEYAYDNNFGVSDYFSFEQKGIPNIHIAQQGISDLILNDDDDPENLDFNKIDILGDALAEFIQQINLD